MKKLISRVIIMCLVSCISVWFCSCGIGKYDNLDENKLLIVTTLFPQYDFAKQIAGDRAEVVLLLSPGVESHDFEPTPSDIILINKADLFIYTGDEMEPWVADHLESIDNKNLNVLDVSKGVELICEEENHDHNHVHDDEIHKGENIIFGEEEGNHDGHDHSHSYDPHIWTSPVNAMKMVENVTESLVKLDEAYSEYYKQNESAYLSELKNIDEQFRKIVSCAKTHTLYFGGRFAMSYFAHEYGLNYVAAFDSCQAKSEPGARLIVKIIEKMREDKAFYVFYEEMTDPKAARIIAEEIDGDILLLHSCHNVSKKEMESGATYISLMKQNVVNLRIALQQ